MSIAIDPKREHLRIGVSHGALWIAALVVAGCAGIQSTSSSESSARIAGTPKAAPAPFASAPIAPAPTLPPATPTAEGASPVQAPTPVADAPRPTVPPLNIPAEVANDSARSGGDGDEIFGIAKVHRIDVRIPLLEWNALQLSSARGSGGVGGTDYTQADGRLVHVGGGFGGYFPWGHADLRLGGQEFKNVGMRYRGNGSFSASSGAAPLRANFKVKLDLFGTKGSWDGEKTLNFNAGSVDGSLMREAMAFGLFRAAGVPAPRTAYAELMFNVPGIYDHTRALYTLIENVNKSFLKGALPPGTGLLMKPEGLRGGIVSYGSNWASYVSAFRPDRAATPHEQQRVMEFAQLISQTDVAVFGAKIGSYLDVDQFLRFLAVNAFIENWDSYLGGSHNFYLYLDPSDDKFRFIPWDEDLSMGSRGGMGGFDLMTPYRGDQPLIYWLLADPAVAAKYREIIRELAATVFSRGAILKMADSIETAIGPRAASPRSYLESRAAYVQQLVAGWAVAPSR